MEVEAPIVREYRLVCDDCGQEAHMVVTTLTDRDVDLLCWPCLMKRALAVAARVVAEEQGEIANA